MAEEPESNGETEDGEEAPTKGKTRLLILIVIIVLLLGGGGAGLYFSGMLGGGEEGEEVMEEVADDSETMLGPDGEPIANLPVYYELPEFLINLSATGKRVSFLKMKVTLELNDQTSTPVIEANKPRIQDTFNTYLRELRAPDLSGSAGMYRLREELLTRVNKVVEGDHVKDILFSEIIIQ